jgi:two-component system chemotaxis response regulator CheB
MSDDSTLVRNAARTRARIDIVAIGASTGGPDALIDLISKLPPDLPVPIVIVQHMPPMFTRLLAERIHGGGNLRVREGSAGQRIRGGQVWIAPGGCHMAVIREAQGAVLTLTDDPPENSCRPAVDVLFRSVAQAYGANALAVVLTGMGADGTRGARAIRDAGGEVFVQDHASSVVWGMPGNVVAAGLADRVCSLDRMPSDIAERLLFGRSGEERHEKRHELGSSVHGTRTVDPDNRCGNGD